MRFWKITYGMLLTVIVLSLTAGCGHKGGKVQAEGKPNPHTAVAHPGTVGPSTGKSQNTNPSAN